MSMIMQIFAPLTDEGQTLQGNKLGDLSISSYDYSNHLYEVGTYTITLSAKQIFAGLIEPSTLLYVGYTDWLIVDTIVREGDTIELRGTDLKGLLARRITLYPSSTVTGAEGYDVIQGSTETVLKHYIANNLTAPSDTNRKIIGLAIAPDQERGIASDTYMSRFERVDELAAKVCKNAKMGYTVTVEGGAMVFEVIEAVDKTAGQSERNRIIFSRRRGNITTSRRERSLASAKNAFYATKSGATLVADALTTLVLRDTDTPRGIERRELHLNVSVDTVADIAPYALKDAADYIDTDSMNVDILGNGYGTDYQLGDIVTMLDEDSGVALDAQITAARLTYTTSGRSVSLTFGDTRPKAFQRLEREIKNRGV